MKPYRTVRLEVPRYSREAGTPVEWEEGAAVWIRIDDGVPLLEGNSAGLRSLARLLLTLAEDRVPSGTHVHLAEFSGLEPGSTEMIVERTDDLPNGSST
jgi:hypothetical protein